MYTTFNANTVSFGASPQGTGNHFVLNRLVQVCTRVYVRMVSLHACMGGPQVCTHTGSCLAWVCVCVCENERHML